MKKFLGFKGNGERDSHNPKGKGHGKKRSGKRRPNEWNDEIKMSVFQKWSRKKVKFQSTDMKTTWQKYLSSEKPTREREKNGPQTHINANDEKKPS